MESVPSMLFLGASGQTGGRNSMSLYAVPLSKNKTYLLTAI